MEWVTDLRVAGPFEAAPHTQLPDTNPVLVTINYGIKGFLSSACYIDPIATRSRLLQEMGREMGMNSGMQGPTPLRFQEIQTKYFLTNGDEGEILIKNVTERGMGCECHSCSIEQGHEISIELPFLGIRAGVVRWVKDGNCGIEMAQPLDVDCLRLYSNIR